MDKDRIAVLERLLVRMEHGDLRNSVSAAEVRALRGALTELMDALEAREGLDEDVDIFEEDSKKPAKQMEMPATDFDDFLKSRKDEKKQES